MKYFEIGSFEAKNRLSELLARAEKGRKICITRRGKRVALLAPADEGPPQAHGDRPSLIQEIREFRARAKPGPESLKQLIVEGRE